MKRKLFSKHIIVTLPLLLFSLLLKAQDPQLSQFYAAPLYLGPSFAGMSNGARVSLNYRKQWPVLTNGFNTYAFGIDNNFTNLKSGMGLIVLRDDIGSAHLSLTSVGAIYSYLIDLDRKWHVKPGITFWYSRHSLDFYKLIFPDQVQNANSSIEVPTQKFKAAIDFSSSVVAYNPKVWFGFTVDHLMRPDESLGGTSNRIPYKFSVYGGTKFLVKNHTRSFRSAEESITTAFLYKRQGNWQQFDLGLYWNKQPIILGVWLRGIPIVVKNPGMDAIVFLAGMRYNGYTIAYSYDSTISQFGVNSGGAHEISITYEFKVQTHKRWKPIPCPTF